LDIGCYHSLSALEREAYRHNLARWLKPGGVYLLYAHQQATSVTLHGVVEADFSHFSRFLSLQWREDSDEHRSDGDGGRAATWAQFTKD
jgi:hypothetical protein